MRLTLKLAVGLVLAILPVIAVSAGVRVDREIHASEADLRDDDALLGRTIADAASTLLQADGSAGATHVRILVDGANHRQQPVAIRWVSLDALDLRDAPSASNASIGALVPTEPRVLRVRMPGDATDTLLTYVAVAGGSGAIEVRRSLAAQESFVHHAIGHAAIATGVVVASCGFLALLLGGILVGKPATRLVAQTRRIGDGDFSTRLQLRQHDELGELGEAIDRMTDRLAEARARLEIESAGKLAALEQMRHADRLATTGKLAAGVAHELGTPLNVISGHAQLITETHEAGTPEFEHATIVIEQTQRVAQIIRQLLGFARRHTPRRTPLDIGQLARETVSMLQPLAAERRIETSVDVIGAGLVCNVGHGQLQQALTNLLVNAFQAIARTGRVTVTVVRTPETATIEVADSGSGIASDILPHIFEPFFTTKDIGKGSGLGLSVSYAIVKDHEGTLEVSSKLGEGARFTITLPLDRSSPSTSTSKEAS